MDQGTYPTHFAAAQGDPLGRDTSADTIHQAVGLIATERGVPETAAYMILVRSSTDQRMSVRDMAAQIVAESRVG